MAFNSHTCIPKENGGWAEPGWALGRWLQKPCSAPLRASPPHLTPHTLHQLPRQPGNSLLVGWLHNYKNDLWFLNQTFQHQTHMGTLNQMRQVKTVVKRNWRANHSFKDEKPSIHSLIVRNQWSRGLRRLSPPGSALFPGTRLLTVFLIVFLSSPLSPGHLTPPCD